MHILVTAFVAAVAVRQASVRATGVVVERIKDNSESFSAFAFIVRATKPGTCFDPPDYEPTDCEQPCAGRGFSVSGFTDDGDKDMVSIDAFDYDFCGDDYYGEFFSAQAMVDVPPAVWKQSKNELDTSADAVLEDYDFGALPPGAGPPVGAPPIAAGPGAANGENPLIGLAVSYELRFSCTDDELEISDTQCKRRTQNLPFFPQTGPPPIEGSFLTKSLQLDKSCNKEMVGLLVVDGVEYTFDNADFGRFRFRSKTFQLEPGSMAEAKMSKK